MNRPKCKECMHMKTYENWGRSGRVYCNHPDKDYIENYCREHRIHSQPGFICLRKRVLRAYSYKYEPTIKTSPRWCPLKNTINDKTEE